MRRFFIPLGQISGDTAWITGSDVNHLHNVLRKGVGDILEATDGGGHILIVELTAVIPERIDFHILERKEQSGMDCIIRIFQAIPRGSSMEIIIEKLAELGVKDIIPVITERTIPRHEGEKALKKQARWQRIADETGKKMGSALTSRIGAISSLKDLPGLCYPGSLRLMPWEVEQNLTLKQALSRHSQKVIEYIIGPEGGFTQKEADLLQDAGFLPVSLGSRVLKVATASIVTAANVIYELSE